MTKTALTASLKNSSQTAWRPVPDWPEYEVSEFGDVRRVKSYQGRITGIIRPWVNKQTGYLNVSLWRNNRGQNATVHRLVARAFHGEPPSPKHVVAHNDGSRRNNHCTNLRWASLKENAADTFLHGTHNRGSRNGQAKIDEICVKAIHKMSVIGIPRREIAEGFGGGAGRAGGVVRVWTLSSGGCFTQRPAPESFFVIPEMDPHPPEFDDPELAGQGTTLQERREILQTIEHSAGRRARTLVKNDDAGGILGWKSHDLPEIPVKGDESPLLITADLEQSLVRSAPKSLLTDGHHIVAFGLEKRQATAADVLVELEPHATRPTGTATTRSRAASAP